MINLAKGRPQSAYTKAP